MDVEVTTMTTRADNEVRELVRDHYGKAVELGTRCGAVPGCCGPGKEASLRLGYTPEDLASLPEGADLGLGCGNPRAIAAMRAGETVLDLGSGAGFDCFLAAKQVGPTGHVIGVDMTPAMITRARANADKIGAHVVDFRLGEIEHLPVADATVDVILSNCVINLSPDKPAVFREAFRVLKHGGRLAIADVVATAPMPAELAGKVEALTGCVSGASQVNELTRWLTSTGFVDVRVTIKPESRQFICDWMPGSGVEDYVASAVVEGRKPSPTDFCCEPSCCSSDTTP
jgi:SAM-dependent methyltransferase